MLVMGKTWSTMGIEKVKLGPFSDGDGGIWAGAHDILLNCSLWESLIRIWVHFPAGTVRLVLILFWTGGILLVFVCFSISFPYYDFECKYLKCLLTFLLSCSESYSWKFRGNIYHLHILCITQYILWNTALMLFLATTRKEYLKVGTKSK